MNSGLYLLFKELAVVVTLALVLALVSKAWVVQAFSIPSVSMQTTLMVGDRVTVSKINPGPFNLQRGDIVVFKDPGSWLRGAKEKAELEARHHPKPLPARLLEKTMQWVGLMPADENDHVIKRLIGLPGDLVECKGPGQPITVNGQPLKETYLNQGVQPSDSPFSVVVPAGRIWVMGDNRNRSGDSRANDAKYNVEHGPTQPGQGPGGTPLPETDPQDYTGKYGSVPIDKVVGRAFALVWPVQHLQWFNGESDVFARVPAPAPDAQPNRSITPVVPAGNSPSNGAPQGSAEVPSGGVSPSPSPTQGQGT